MKLDKSTEFLYVLKNNKELLKFLGFTEEGVEEQSSDDFMSELGDVITRQFAIVCKLINIALNQNKTVEEMKAEYDHFDIVVLLFAIFKVNIGNFLLKLADKVVVGNIGKKMQSLDKMLELNNQSEKVQKNN